MKTLLALSIVFITSCSKFYTAVESPAVADSSRENFYANDLAFPMEVESLIDHEYAVNSKPVIFGNTLIYQMANGRIVSYNLEKKYTNDSYRFTKGGNNELVVSEKYILSTQAIGEENVTLIDAEEGEFVWQATIPFGIESTPIVSGGVAVVASASGAVFGLDLASGIELWKIQTRKPVYADMLLDGKHVVVANDAGDVHRIEIKTGKTAWKKNVLGEPIVVKPLLVDGQLFIAGTEGTLKTIDSKSGKPLKSQTFSAGFYANAAFDGNAIYIGNNNATLYKLSKTGEELWAFKTPEIVRAQPLLGDKFVYFGDGSGQFYVLNKADASVKFEQKFRGRFVASPIFWNKKLLVFSDNDDIYLFGEPEPVKQQGFRFF